MVTALGVLSPRRCDSCRSQVIAPGGNGGGSHDGSPDSPAPASAAAGRGCRSRKRARCKAMIAALGEANTLRVEFAEMEVICANDAAGILGLAVLSWATSSGRPAQARQVHHRQPKGRQVRRPPRNVGRGMDCQEPVPIWHWRSSNKPTSTHQRGRLHLKWCEAQVYARKVDDVRKQFAALPTLILSAPTRPNLPVNQLMPECPLPSSRQSCGRRAPLVHITTCYESIQNRTLTFYE
jgi:hypothetical protein